MNLAWTGGKETSWNLTIIQTSIITYIGMFLMGKIHLLEKFSDLGTTKVDPNLLNLL